MTTGTHRLPLSTRSSSSPRAPARRSGGSPPAAAAESYHLTAPDYPGYGNSSAFGADEFDYTFNHLANLIERFTEQIRNHPLRREIIVTQVVNDLVNGAGMTFWPRLGGETGVGPAALTHAPTEPLANQSGNEPTIATPFNYAALGIEAIGARCTTLRRYHKPLAAHQFLVTSSFE